MKRDRAHDPRAIANAILDIRAESGKPLTIMQLIKLAYIADGWSMVLGDGPLIDESPEAWQYGPVYPSIYNAFSGIGSKPVSKRACVEGTDIPIIGDLSENETKILRMVVNSYGKLSAYGLSQLTHKPETPWSKAFERAPYAPLDIADMIEHFESLKEKRLVKKAN